jgi:hypothetical protein
MSSSLPNQSLVNQFEEKHLLSNLRHFRRGGDEFESEVPVPEGPWYLAILVCPFN